MPDSQKGNGQGIAWMLATMFCFVALDTIMKYGLERHSIVEVSWARFSFSTLFAAMIAGPRLPQTVRSSTPIWQLARSVMLAVTTGLFNAGVGQVSLPTATTMMMLTPILVTLIAAVFLGEHVGWRRMLSICAGLVGAMIVARVWEFGSGGLNAGVLFLLAAACTNASYQGVTRLLRGDSPYTTLLYSGAAGAVVASFMLPWAWTWPDTTGWALFIGSGIFACVGHLCLIRAYHAAPASVIAPFYYSSIVWSVISGLVIWGDLPDATTAIGAAILIASGLYIIWRERRLGLADKKT